MNSKKLSYKETVKIIVLVVVVIFIFLYPEQARFELSQKNTKREKGPVVSQPAYSVSVQMSDKEFTAYTLRVFQPLTSRKLTDEDARQITQNMTGFMKTLIDWNSKG